MNKKKELGKYGIRGLKQGKTLYFPIEAHGRLRCLCSYYKKAHGLVYEVNQYVKKGVELIGVTRK